MYGPVIESRALAPRSSTIGDLIIKPRRSANCPGRDTGGRNSHVCTASHVRPTPVAVVRQDTSYLEHPMGQEADRYLAIKRKRLTDASYRGYEHCLAELALFYPDKVLEDFIPPAGTELIEEFLHTRWGRSEPRTYNKNLSILSDFFKWQALRQRLLGDPTLPIERAKKKAIYRSTFTKEQVTAILAAARGPRERIALRLLLNYGIRKGTLQKVRLHHFSAERRHVVLFTKGQKVQTLPIPQQVIWDDLDLIGGQPHHYLLPKQKLTRRPTESRRAAVLRDRIEALQAELAECEENAEWVRLWPDEQIGDHGAHSWWYRCLARAGVVEEGVERGAKMHRARHTAGQHLLDKTGNLKLVQVTLGHTSSNTTADHYVGWEFGQHAESLAEHVTA